MKTHRTIVGVIFTGLLPCGFLSGCAREVATSSTKTVAVALGSGGTMIQSGSVPVQNLPASPDIDYHKWTGRDDYSEVSNAAHMA